MRLQVRQVLHHLSNRAVSYGSAVTIKICSRMAENEAHSTALILAESARFKPNQKELKEKRLSPMGLGYHAGFPACQKNKLINFEVRRYFKYIEM